MIPAGTGKNNNPKVNRVAIIGSRFVSPVNIYSLMTNGVIDELVLIDGGSRRLMTATEHLTKFFPLEKPANLTIGELSDAKSWDIAVIAEGVYPIFGEGEESYTRRNAKIVCRIMQDLKKGDFNGVVLITTAPADVLAEVAQQTSGFPPEKIIGSGLSFDSRKFRNAFDWNFQLQKNRTAFWGENDFEVSTWCAALISDEPTVEYCEPNCPHFPLMEERLRTNLYPHSSIPVKIKRGNTALPDEHGTCINRICQAILRDEQIVLPVIAATKNIGLKGLNKFYMNAPCVVGRGGISRVFEMETTSRADFEEFKKTVELHESLVESLLAGKKVGRSRTKAGKNL